MNVQYSYRNFTFFPHWISAAKYRWLMSWKIVMIWKVKRCCSSCSNWLMAAQSVCVAVPGSLITPLNLPLLRSFRYASPYLWNQLPSFRQPHSVHSPPMEFILSPRRGGPPQTNLPHEEGPSTSPLRQSWRPADAPSCPLHANLLLHHETDGIHTTNSRPLCSVGIDLKELGGQLPKCLV